MPISYFPSLYISTNFIILQYLTQGGYYIFLTFIMEVFKRKIDSGIFAISLNDGILEINLTNCINDKKIEYFAIMLTEDTCPQELKLIPLSLPQLFQIFKEEKSLRINWSEGIVFFKYMTNIGGLKIEKQIMIALERKKMSQNEEIRVLISILRQENSSLHNQNESLNKKINEMQNQVSMKENKKQNYCNNCHFYLCIFMFVISILCYSSLRSQYDVLNLKHWKTSFQLSELSDKVQEIKQNFDINQKFSITPFSPFFTFQDNKITYLGNYQNKYVQLLKNQPINPHLPYTFEINLRKLQKGRLLIGIVDRKQQLRQRSSYKSGNAVVLSSILGTIYYGIGTKETGNLLKEGDTVTVKVDLGQGKIKWMVNGQTFGQIKLSFLKDETAEFVPYVEFLNSFDQIQWVS